MSRITPEQWAERAEELRPALHRETVAPVQTVTPVRDENVFQG